MDEAVRRRLFEPVTARTHDLAEHYDNPDDLIEAWSGDEQWISQEFERRLRSTTGPVHVVERLVFRLYRTRGLRRRARR